MTAINQPRAVAVWSRRLFVFWISLSALIALFAVVGGPLISIYGVVDTEWVAVVSPLAVALFLASGLAWLALSMTAQKQQS